MKEVHVVIGVLRHEDKILISKRLENQFQADYWEFPGGQNRSE